MAVGAGGCVGAHAGVVVCDLERGGLQTIYQKEVLGPQNWAKERLDLKTLKSIWRFRAQPTSVLQSGTNARKKMVQLFTNAVKIVRPPLKSQIFEGLLFLNEFFPQFQPPSPPNIIYVSQENACWTFTFVRRNAKKRKVRSLRKSEKITGGRSRHWQKSCILGLKIQKEKRQGSTNVGFAFDGEKPKDGKAVCDARKSRESVGQQRNSGARRDHAHTRQKSRRSERRRDHGQRTEWKSSSKLRRQRPVLSPWRSR